MARAGLKSLGEWHPLLEDAYGRPMADVRMSLTNRCNFNCVYCHNEGLGQVQPAGGPVGDEMTTSEAERLLTIARGFGVRAVKFTGGEPLLRQDLESIVAHASDIGLETSVTTNGSLLKTRARGLRDAGLDRVNVSIDTLDPDHFARIRKGSLAPVLAGVDAALAAGLTPVKVNSVIFDETVDRLPEILAFARERPGIMLQLIEIMPEIRTDMAPRRVNVARVHEWLAAESDRVEVRSMHHRRIYHVGDTRVEVVDPVGNEDFCMNCHRVRITHDGRIKGCLNRDDDLVPTRGLDDDGVRAAYRTAVANRVPYYGVYLNGNSRSGIPVTLRR